MQQDFLDLSLTRVDRWVGLQLAMEQDSVIWQYDHIPWIQFYCIDIYLEAAKPVKLDAGLDCDGNWYGLRLNAESNVTEPFPHTPDSILRYRALDDLPVGQIECVNPTIDKHGQCVRVSFSIAGKEVLFIAGEIAFQHDVPVIVEPNEFVLLAIP